CQPISQLVLWDPCVSGRAYLREQTRLYQLKVEVSEPRTPESVTVGMVFSPDTARALGALELADVEFSVPHVSGVLLMPRPERATSAAIEAIAARPGVELVEATEQTGLLDVPSQDVAMPHATVNEISTYLALHATSPTSMPEYNMTEYKVCDEAMVGATPDGRPIVERLLRVGPRQLFAVVTSIEAPNGATIVCVSQANAHRVGPARLWPEMARLAAAQGVSTVRYDRRSVGDSPVDHDGVVPAYTHEAVEDLADVVTAICADQSRLALVGLCSGAWASIVVAGSEVHPHSVYSINPGSWQLRPAPQPQAQGAPPTTRPAASFAASRLRTRIKALMPYALALRGARKGRTELPEVLLAPVVKRGIAVTLMFGSWDATHFAEMSGQRAIRRMRRRGVARLVVDPEIEHSLIVRTGRDLVARRIVDEVAAIARP
ncbi:MAG TPA: alpha/beta fold hydrolase, partial [Acidothermaceae bacterium]